MKRPGKAASTATKTRRAGRLRDNDPQATRRNIIDVATHEFAQKGYGGARVDAIAARTRTSKRMIYYHFSGKEGLYLAVLEAAYSGIRREEATLDLDHLAPEAALRRLIASTFDYYIGHPEFVRLVMNENIMDGVHMKRSRTIGKLNLTVIDALTRIVRRGQKAGAFRAGIDPLELHMSISALGIFHVANRATFSTIFKLDMSSPKAVAARRKQVVEIVLGHVRSTPRPFSGLCGAREAAALTK
jgi:AcrR family transcriptional regulator